MPSKKKKTKQQQPFSLSLGTFPASLVAASTEELDGAKEWLEKALISEIVSAPALIASNISSLYEAKLEAINTEKDRREAASDIDHLLSSYASQVISQLLAYALNRSPSSHGYSRLNLAANDKGGFYAGLTVSNKGGAKRGFHLDDVLMRLQIMLAEKTAKNKISFPLFTSDPELLLYADRIQRVIIFAHMTGTTASFGWSISERMFNGNFQSHGFSLKSGVKQAKDNLPSALIQLESLAAIKT
jgi:hypothetical protein